MLLLALWAAACGDPSPPTLSPQVTAQLTPLAPGSDLSGGETKTAVVPTPDLPQESEGFSAPYRDPAV
ncbi:MAG: hypothetical protein ACP5HG_08420, partial [Anaerolineae bacterium]